MVYGVILAGGVGSRMGGDKPKQYMNLNGRPIIVYTIEKMFSFPDFEEIIVLCPNQWVEHTKNIIAKNIPSSAGRVSVIEGGATRNETIMNAIDYIGKKGQLDENTIIVTHDSVRPFVTHRILRDNIKALEKYDACDTVIPATDTIVESQNGETISAIPNRQHMFQGQTPQSFRALPLKELYTSLSQEEKDILTDAAKIFVLKGKSVALVDGETFNIKITYPYDLRIAKSLLEDEND